MLASSDAVRFGNLKSEVISVSPDATENADGVPFYKIRIATDKTYFQRGAVKYQLVPGVRVVASIRTGQRSVLAYLADPFLGSKSASRTTIRRASPTTTSRASRSMRAQCGDRDGSRPPCQR